MYFWILIILEQRNVTCNMYFYNYSENVRMISRFSIVRASNNKWGLNISASVFSLICKDKSHIFSGVSCVVFMNVNKVK
jgi:hypothetical protein